MDNINDSLLFGAKQQMFVDLDKVQPYRGRIIVQIDLLPETTPAGIVFPYMARVQTQPHKTGTVLKCNPSFTEEHGVKAGDKVILDNFGSEQWLDHKPWSVALLREEDILCLITDSEAHDSKPSSERSSTSPVSSTTEQELPSKQLRRAMSLRV